MTPHAASNIPKEIQDVFWKIHRAVDALPDDLELGAFEGKSLVLSCHILTRAVCSLVQLTVKDGVYGFRSTMHSWMETASGDVIDVYPVAVIGGPFMIDGNFVRVCRHSMPFYYHECAEKYPIWTKQLLDSAPFKTAVKIVKKNLEPAFKENNFALP